MLDSQGNPLKFGDEVLLHGQITGMSSRGDGTTIITVRGLDLGGKGRFAGIYAVESDIVRLFNSPAPAPAVAPSTSAVASAPGTPVGVEPHKDATAPSTPPADAASHSPTTPTASTAAPTDEQAKASAVASPAVAEPAVK